MYGKGRAADCKIQYYDNNDVRPGDVIKTSGDPNPHYIVVLARKGEQLYTAEGNASGIVRISDSVYTISNIKGFPCGWHY